MRKYRCSFCGYCGFSGFWKTAITAETAKTAYAISSIILLYIPCATCWISWRLILFCSQRSIVLLPIPRTSACFTASCLVKQSFESVDEIRSPQEASRSKNRSNVCEIRTAFGSRCDQFRQEQRPYSQATSGTSSSTLCK